MACRRCSQHRAVGEGQQASLHQNRRVDRPRVTLGKVRSAQDPTRRPSHTCVSPAFESQVGETHRAVPSCSAPGASPQWAANDEYSSCGSIGWVLGQQESTGCGSCGHCARARCKDAALPSVSSHGWRCHSAEESLVGGWGTGRKRGTLVSTACEVVTRVGHSRQCLYCTCRAAWVDSRDRVSERDRAELL